MPLLPSHKNRRLRRGKILVRGPGELDGRRERDSVARLAGIGQRGDRARVAQHGEAIGRFDAIAGRGHPPRHEQEAAPLVQAGDSLVLGPILEQPVLSRGVQNFLAGRADERSESLHAHANIHEKLIRPQRREPLVVPIDHIDGEPQVQKSLRDLATFPQVRVRIGHAGGLRVERRGQIREEHPAGAATPRQAK